MDAVELQVVRHLLEGVAEAMGHTLERTAHSANITQRRDFSCAVFDADRKLIAQATHIPVHLGSMTASVEAATEIEGDVLLNDPYAGGSHLPDLTLVSPVVVDGVTIAYVANRAHHADVGGASPGGMTIGDHIDREGVRLPPGPLAANREVLLAGSRRPDERAADLDAQVNANRVGARMLAELAGRLDLAAAGRALCDYGRRLMAAVVAGLPDGVYEASDQMTNDGLSDEPVTLRLTLTIDGDRATLDFTRSDDAARGPINCPAAVTSAAAAYCFLCLLHDAHDDAPLNAGAFEPLDVVTRPGSLLHAVHPSPVCAGNTETSMRVVDVTFAALRQAAGDRVPSRSAGTMSSLALGGDGGGFTYYETIPGGSGAPAGKPRASAVQTHMTNTRNTPAEVLEVTYPLRVWSFALAGDRPGSGVVREIEVLGDTTATLIGDRSVPKFTRTLRAGETITVWTPDAAP